MNGRKFIVAHTADFNDNTGTPRYRDIGLSVLENIRTSSNESSRNIAAKSAQTRLATHKV